MHTPINVSILANYPAHVVMQALANDPCTAEELQERMRRRGIYHTTHMLEKRLVGTLLAEKLVTVQSGLIELTERGTEELETLNAESLELGKSVAGKRTAGALFDDNGKRKHSDYDGAELGRQPGIPDERYAAFDLPSVQGRWRVWPRNSRPPELVNPGAAQQDAGDLLAGGL